MTATRHRIRGVLLDLSGTLHQGSTAIPGAAEAVEKLSDASLRIRVLTNTSKTSSSELYQHLQEMGFASIQPNQIFTSVLTTRDYLIKHNLRPYCLLEDVSDFKQVDLCVNLDPPHNAVVVGLAPSKFNYEHMNQAFQILQEYPENLVAIHRANYVKEEDGSMSLGPGSCIAALEAAANTTAKVVGKPSRDFYASAIWNDISPEEICMVGDDVMGDIKGAQQAGVGTTILVQTGKYREGDEEKAQPTVVVQSIVEAVEYILEHSRDA
jgi:HAD superfamily hydrolase (TIGR01458 family)